MSSVFLSASLESPKKDKRNAHLGFHAAARFQSKCKSRFKQINASSLASAKVFLGSTAHPKKLR